MKPWPGTSAPKHFGRRETTRRSCGGIPAYGCWAGTSRLAGRGRESTSRHWRSESAERRALGSGGGRELAGTVGTAGCARVDRLPAERTLARRRFLFRFRRLDQRERQSPADETDDGEFQQNAEKMTVGELNRAAARKAQLRPGLGRRNGVDNWHDEVVH